jgi:tetratricopeptide (TPR) repeat protein
MVSDRRDAPSRPAHKVLYDLKVARADGAEFQSLFERIMENHDRSFCRVKPGGPAGDWKSDGYSTADGTVYQCYAPEIIRAKPTRHKIDEDFAGAQAYWGDRLKRWIFVVNRDGLPAEVIATLADLKQAQAPTIDIDWYTPERLWSEIVVNLSDVNLTDLLGQLPPTENPIKELMKQAGNALRSEDRTKTRALCAELLERTKDFPAYRKDRADVHHLLAHLELGERNPKEARRHLDLADAELTSDAPAYLRIDTHRLRAGCWADEGESALAVAEFQQALDTPPSSHDTEKQQRTFEDCRCFTHIDLVLHRTGHGETSGLDEHIAFVDAYVRDHPMSQDGHLALRAAEMFITYHARRGDEQRASRALDLIRSTCSTKELAFAGATLLQRLTGRTAHLKATTVALECAKLSAELAERAERTDFYWAAQANLVSVYLSSGQLEQARRQLEVLDPVLRNDQADPQLKAGILSLAAMVLAQSGAKDQAVGLVEKAQQHMRADPASAAQTEFDRGRYLREAGRTDEALGAFSKADRLARDAKAPGEFIFHINVLAAKAAVELGRWDEAEARIETLESLPRGHEFVDDVLDILRKKLKGTREIKRRIEDIRALEAEGVPGSLRDANGQTFKSLVSLWQDYLANVTPTGRKKKSGVVYADEDYQNVGILYDFWGGGNAARVLVNLRKHAPDHFTPFVEVRSVQEVKRAIRMLTLVSDCLVLLWKGAIETGWTKTVVPADYECGGAGYLGFYGTLFRGPKVPGPWVYVMGRGPYLPHELIKFLATDALPLIEQGRLFVVPAPAVGCSEDPFGAPEYLLADLMAATPLAQSMPSGPAFPLGVLPYFEDAPFGTLADLAAKDANAPRRLRLALIRKTGELRTHRAPETVSREIADEIADALAALDSTHRGLSRKRGYSTGHDPLGATAISFQNAWAPVLTLRRLGYRMTLAEHASTKIEARKRFIPEKGTPFGNWLQLPGQNMGIPVMQAPDET